MLYTFFFEKSGRVLCINAVELEPVPTRVLNQKACEIQGRSSGGGCLGEGEGKSLLHIKKNC